MADKASYVLLADDDSEDRELLKEIISDLEPGVTIETVTNGQEAVLYLFNRLPAELPSLIILDYKMPIMSAADVLDRLRGDSRFDHIPKAVWSTSGQHEHIRVCMERGANSYFTKPTSATDLVLMAKKMLGLRHNNS
jgi:CheY-like chemotaxis protein